MGTFYPNWQRLQDRKDGLLHGYDIDYGISGDSCIHSTSTINIGYNVAVASKNHPRTFES